MVTKLPRIILFVFIVSMIFLNISPADARKPVSTYESQSMEEEEEPQESQKIAESFEESSESEKDDHDLNDKTFKHQEHENARKPALSSQSHSTEEEEESEEIQKSVVSSEESNDSKKDDHDLNDQNLKPQQHKKAAKAVLRGAKEMAADAILYGTAAAAKVSEMVRGIAHKMLDHSHIKQTLNIFDDIHITARVTTIAALGPNEAKARMFNYLAAAAYCSLDLERWKCAHCEVATTFGYEFYGQMYNDTTHTFGFIALNHEKKEIVVSFRGSMNVASAVQDVSFRLKNIKNDKDRKIKVHEGFLLATNSLYPQVLEQVSKAVETYTDYSLNIIGHSLGASMASVTFYMMLKRLGTPDDFPEPAGWVLVTFGQPRTGNKAYADFLNGREDIEMTRVVNNGDVVPHANLVKFGVIHHGTEFFVTPAHPDGVACAKNVYEDPDCSNNLGPIYSMMDHLYVWDVAYHHCGMKQPMTLIHT